ncbi:MAG: alpha-N-acetylglucosaminidase [Verrucomicrobiota bacterium]
MNLPTLCFTLIAFSVSLSISSQAKTDTIGSSKALLERMLPKERLGDFALEALPADSDSDAFELESRDGKLIIRGNNGVAIASGLNWFLTKHCNSQVSMTYSTIDLPDPLPTLKEKVRVESPFDYRYFFNYCTYGYSMPWWGWERWEEMIDYMACMGVNMPLATIGQEAVWREVYRELGMSDEQLDEFFVGPAHLPWGWMGNIDGLGGPLPQDWIDQRAKLQVKVLERMRALGMKPVLQGFTGHVPIHLRELFPDADIVKIHDWAGIPGTQFLSPEDPLFSRIGTMFIKKQTEMFGTDHYYDADCFIEVDPPSSDPEYLAKVSKGVFDSMTAADPEAVWVMQGWFFFFRSEFWKPEQGRAFLEAIPEGRVIMLDLYGERNPVWDKTEAFYGQPWIWNVICNEDQKVNMSGDLDIMQRNFLEAWKAEGKNGLKGIGTIPEGVGYNPVVQDFIYSRGWDVSEVDMKQWVADYGERRYATENPKASEAWQALLGSVYGRTRVEWNPLIITPQLQIFNPIEEDIRLVRKDIRITEENPLGTDFDAKQLYKASGTLLDLADELKDVESYRFDLVNVHREMLSGLCFVMIDDLTKAYQSGDATKLKAAGGRLLGLFDDLEKLTGTEEMFLLGDWIEEARSWGKTKEEKDYYEWNARTIVTIWQPWPEGGLRDYAGKQWNGLFGSYYRPRWALLVEMLNDSIESGKDFDPQAYDKKLRAMDYKWTRSTGGIASEPTGDPVEESRRVREKYGHYFTK